MAAIASGASLLISWPAPLTICKVAWESNSFNFFDAFRSVSYTHLEVQAESVAYAVCQHYGLDTSDYSFGYVAGWSSGKDLKELRASLETVSYTHLDVYKRQLQD